MKPSECKKIVADIKQTNIPFVLNEAALKGLVCRIAGETYANRINFQQISPKDTGMDRYWIGDDADGRILIKATSGVAAAGAFRWYMENRCDSYVGPLNRRLNFPEVPPKVGETYESNSICLYRYCFNYCTYGYTFPFWKWEQWEELIDWLILSGYNLILNPLGNESVWLLTLKKLGYDEKQAKAFLCSPTIYPWQCMMNITGWAGAAPDHFYDERLVLSKKFNDRLRSFGAEPVVPGWSGMVPQDFQDHFPESNPYHQGLWSGMPRPSILLQDDACFDLVASTYYESMRELLGEFSYFSTDPFHEGGDSSKVDLQKYARRCLHHMNALSEHPVWFLQGWGNNPLRDLLKALPVENVLIGDLRSTFGTSEDSFAGYPWLFGTVDNFGGQRRLRGNLPAISENPLPCVKNEELTAVGVAMFPEGLETEELMFDAVADIAFSGEMPEPDLWLRKRLCIRYGADSKCSFEAMKLVRDRIYTGAEHRDSGLLSRPSLTVAGGICHVYELTYEEGILENAFVLLLKDYDLLSKSEAYRMDLMDLGRQILANRAWTPIKGLQDAFNAGNIDAFEENAKLLMYYYDLQEDLLCCDKHTLLGRWIDLARSWGENDAEKAYFEFQARTLITLWGDRAGSGELHDYAAREWDGMIRDFYRPRWESYINILRWSLITGNKPMDYSRYDVEYYFTTMTKHYPTEPYGDLETAAKHIYELVK